MYYLHSTVSVFLDVERVSLDAIRSTPTASFLNIVGTRLRISSVSITPLDVAQAADRFGARYIICEAGSASTYGSRLVDEANKLEINVKFVSPQPASFISSLNVVLKEMLAELEGGESG